MRKKLLIASLLIASMSFSACEAKKSDDKNPRKEMTKGAKEREARMQEMKAKRAERDSLSKLEWDKIKALPEKERSEWLAREKAKIDRRDSIQAAKAAQVAKEWATFDTSSVERKIELLKMKGAHPVINDEHSHGGHGGHGHAGHGGHAGHKHGEVAPPYNFQKFKPAEQK